ncbi:MAG: hypothetical protein V3U71_00600 [Cocleimonas sp.]
MTTQHTTKRFIAVLFSTAILLTTANTEAECWTAGAFDGSCLAKTDFEFKKTTRYGQSCWTAGVMNNMCYERSTSTKEAQEKPPEKSCWTAGVLNGMCY